jgi:hypothetical protein
MNVEMEEAKQEVVKATEKVKTEVVKAVDKAVQELSADEKLSIREIENEYLKAQIEINRLSQITQNAQKKFTDTVEGLVKKYAVSPAEWIFDNVTLTFKRK